MLTAYRLSNIAQSEYTDVETFIEHGYFRSNPITKYKKTKYANLGCAFDIETSKAGEYSFMYVWQFAIDDITVIGRSWESFNRLLDYINKSNDSGATILCYIHNFSYEFQFMKNYVNWNINEKSGVPDIFAIDKRQVVYGKVGSIEFRDSYVLTNKKLELLAKDYKLGIEKLVGDLDYNLVRLPTTKLTGKEIAYCINDVQILQKFFHKYIKKEYIDKGYKIPLTSTGIVRNELKRNFKKLSKKERETWQRRVKKGFPKTKREYTEVMRWLYRGGYVHGNAIYTEDILTNRDMSSYDYKSSYPAVLLHNKYPFKFVSRETSFFDKIKNDRKWMNENAFYGTFRFNNIRLKSGNFHSIESKNKIFTSKNAKYDNGRLVSADEIVVCLTEQDWLNYNDFMEWDNNVECLSIKISSKEALPSFITNLVIKYFEMKETLPKDNLDYLLCKMKLNAIYGMCCTGLYDTSLFFENGVFELSEKMKDYRDLVEKQLLLPWIGIWCTAYARRNLLHTVSKIGNSVIYCDTDSIKMINTTANVKIIKEYNDRIVRLNKILPEKLSEIGKFDYEGRLWKFKEYGAKRYISTTYDKKQKRLVTKPTIAGLPKKAIIEHCEKTGIDIYSFFEKDMRLSGSDTKKLRAKYIDEPFSIEVTDYQGTTDTVDVKSCVTLLDTDFEMNVVPEYISYYLETKRKAEMIIGVRI